VRRIAPDEVESTEHHLEQIVDRWTRFVELNDRLVYHKPKWSGDTKHRPEAAALLRTSRTTTSRCRSPP